MDGLTALLYAHADSLHAFVFQEIRQPFGLSDGEAKVPRRFQIDVFFAFNETEQLPVMKFDRLDFLFLFEELDVDFFLFKVRDGNVLVPICADGRLD